MEALQEKGKAWLTPSSDAQHSEFFTRTNLRTWKIPIMNKDDFYEVQLVQSNLALVNK